MTTPIHAIRALRWNYRWSGVWVWMRARHGRHGLVGHGWWLVLRHPAAVVADQLALAEGVTS